MGELREALVLVPLVVRGTNVQILTNTDSTHVLILTHLGELREALVLVPLVVRGADEVYAGGRELAYSCASMGPGKRPHCLLLDKLNLAAAS